MSYLPFHNWASVPSMLVLNVILIQPSRVCYHFFYDRIDLFVSGLYLTVFTLIFTTFTQKVTAL